MGQRPAGKWTGHYLDLSLLSDDEREAVGLSCDATIVEVIGSRKNKQGLKEVREAVEYARSRSIATLDLETDADEDFTDDEFAGLDPHKMQIVLCQIGDAERQYLIWWQTISEDAKEIIREWWSDPEHRKAGVNLKFDAKALLGKEGLHWRGERLIDAQIAEQVLGCGLLGADIGHTMKLTGMGAMAKRWLGWLMPKDEDIRTGWGKMTPGQWYPTKAEYDADVKNGMVMPPYAEVKARGIAKRYYAADDCVVPVRLLALQGPWLKEFELLDSFKLEMDFLPVLAEMEVRGLPFDWEQWVKLAHEAEADLAKAEAALDALFEVTVTHRVDLEGNVEITRDKNYGSKDELKELIRHWMLENYGVEVIGNNRQFREACLKGGMTETRAAKVFQQKLVPSPDDTTKNKQVGYPNMTDYVEGSQFVESRWEEYKYLLPPNSFALPTTDSKFLKLLRILHETEDDQIDDLEEIPTKMGLPPELVDPILAHREASTKLQRYAFSWEKLINPVSGRVHTDASQAASDTARVQTRPNLQNLPSDPRYREASCKARPGYKIVGADFSQIEPRIIAQISLCKMYMNVFWSERPGTEGFAYWCDESVTEPLDLYGAVGATIGVLPPEAAKKSVAKQDDPEIKKGRKESKIVVLGLGYGTGKPKFHISYCLDTKEYQSREKSDRLFDGFWDAAVEVKETLNMLSDLAYPGPGTRSQSASPRYVYHPILEDKVTWSESLGGRKRYFDKKSQSWWTQGRNHPIQSTGADILKKTCVEMARWLWEEKIDGFILLTAHDELIAEIREDQADRVARKMEEVMSEVGQEYCPNVPISAEAYVEDFWLKD
jgi:DNA polymerase I-like protein with 3'-5' exonuclease and polymerase domains